MIQLETIITDSFFQPGEMPWQGRTQVSMVEDKCRMKETPSEFFFPLHHMMQISKEHLLLFILWYSMSVFLLSGNDRIDTDKFLPLVPFFPQICILLPKRISNYGLCVLESALHRLRGHKYESRSLYALRFVPSTHGIVHHAIHANEVEQRGFPCQWLRCTFVSRRIRFWGKSSSNDP